MDPVRRDAQGIVDSIRNSIPTLSENLPPRRNIFGFVQVYSGALGPDFVSPFYSQTTTVDPVFDEMEKSVFDMVVAGKVNDRGEVDIVMVEAGATESAMELIDEGSTVPDEKVVADGINEAKEHISKLIDLQNISI